MAGRRTKPEVNRRGWHAARVESARTPKARLWAYCHWLVAEAFHAGQAPLDDVTQVVRGEIDKLTEARTP